MNDAVVAPRIRDDIDGLEAALGILLGRSAKGWTCDCGGAHCASGPVTRVNRPEGDDAAGMACLWTVDITPAHDRGWSTGISAFLTDSAIEEMFDAHLARTAAVRRSLEASLTNYVAGTWESVADRDRYAPFPDEFLPGAATHASIRYRDNYEHAHCWDVNVAPAGGRPWRRRVSDLVTRPQFEALLAEIGEIVDRTGEPVALSRSAVHGVFERADAQLAADADGVEAFLRDNLLGQRIPHAYSSRAPEEITGVVCRDAQAPRRPDSWDLELTASGDAGSRRTIRLTGDRVSREVFTNGVPQLVTALPARRGRRAAALA